MPKGYQVCVCGELVPGPRTLICPACKGTLRKAKVNVDAENGEAVATRKVWNFPQGYTIPDRKILRIETPAGYPPIALRAKDGESFPDDDTLLGWAGDVRQSLLHKGQYINNNGLIYWARQTLNRKGEYSPAGDEMQYVGLVIGSLPDIVCKEIPV